MTTNPQFYEAFHTWFMQGGCDFWSESNASEELAAIAARLHDAAINTPELADFIEGVKREAAHQVVRWGTTHDRSKSAENWYWLIGYLSGKALRAHVEGDRDKALHHTISAASALFQWHKAISEDENDNGIGRDDDLVALAKGETK